MINTDRAPDDVIQVDHDYPPFGWMDRFRILLGCAVHQRMPVAVWYEIEGGTVRSTAMIPRNGGMTVERFFSSAAALPAPSGDAHGTAA